MYFIQKLQKPSVLTPKQRLAHFYWIQILAVRRSTVPILNTEKYQKTSVIFSLQSFSMSRHNFCLNKTYQNYNYFIEATSEIQIFFYNYSIIYIYKYIVIVLGHFIFFFPGKTLRGWVNLLFMSKLSKNKRDSLVYIRKDSTQIGSL